VFLNASPEVRAHRFNQAAVDGDVLKRSMTFADAMQHPTETEVLRLRRYAHLVLDSDEMAAPDVVAAILAAGLG
jgi:cytidylate kinase